VCLIYPTTLSIITLSYPDRRERTAAIGVWGAITGLGVAVGPVTGGLLLAHFWYGSVFPARAQLASRIGTRVIVVCGLAIFGIAFAWIAVSATKRALPPDRRADGDHGHRSGPDQHPSHRVHPQRAGSGRQS
jgi:MFS family permease